MPDPPPTRRRRPPAPLPFGGMPSTQPTFAEPQPLERVKPQSVTEPVGTTCTEPPKPPEQQVSPSSPPQPLLPNIPRWLLQVRELHLVDVTEVLGLDVEGDRLRPCPRCNNEAEAEVYASEKGGDALEMPRPRVEGPRPPGPRLIRLYRGEGEGPRTRPEGPAAAVVRGSGLVRFRGILGRSRRSPLSYWDCRGTQDQASGCHLK